MKLNNYDLIRPLLKFDSEDDYYFLQIVIRKKDNPTLFNHKGNNNTRSVRIYYINSLDYFDYIQEEVKILCEATGARAGINLNKKSYKKTFFEFKDHLNNLDRNSNIHKAYRAYDSSAGTDKVNSGKSRWLIDVDAGDLTKVEEIKEVLLEKCRPLGVNKIIKEIPSKSGIHLITSRFDRKTFKKEFPNLELHTNNPTNLYIP